MGVMATNGVQASPERLAAIYELTARINNGLALGCFWVDDDGQVTFAIAASMIDVEPTDAWIGSAMCTAVSTYDDYFPAVCRVIYADTSPTEALNSNDGPTDEEVAQSVARLFDSGDAVELPSGSDEELELEDASADDPEPESEEVVIRMPGLPNLIAKVTPQDIEDVKRLLARGGSGGDDITSEDGDER